MRSPHCVRRIGIGDGLSYFIAEPGVVDDRRVRPAQGFRLIWTPPDSGVRLMIVGIDVETRDTEIISHIGRGGVEIAP